MSENYMPMSPPPLVPGKSCVDGTAGGLKKEIGRVVTIADAKNQFRNSTAQTAGYRELVTLLIDSGFDKSFKNDSYFDALVLTEAMLDRSKRSIELMTGPAGDGFLCELKESFIAAIERVKEAGGKVRLIMFCEEKPSQSAILDLAKKFSGTLEVAFAKPSKKLNHFIVCDSRIVRLESIHGELSDSTGADEIKAEVFFNNPQQGRMLEMFFNAVWTSLKPERV